MVGTTISILEAPPFCHGSARSCPTTSFFNNFGFAEYYQVGHITAYKGVLGTNLDGRHGEAHAAKGLTAFGASLTRNRYF